MKVVEVKLVPGLLLPVENIQEFLYQSYGELPRKGAYQVSLPDGSTAIYVPEKDAWYTYKPVYQIDLPKFALGLGRHGTVIPGRLAKEHLRETFYQRLAGVPRGGQEILDEYFQRA